MTDIVLPGRFVLCPEDRDGAGIGRRTGEMLETEGLRTVQRKVLMMTENRRLRRLRSNKDSGHGTLTRMFGTPSLPMFRRKYYKKSRQLNPALVQRKTILPVPLVLIPWCSASSRLRYSRSSEITRGRDQH